jgi:hypothetical protein
MTRDIPGMIEVDGREFLYIEIVKGQTFRQLIDETLSFSSNIPMPQSGGVIEEKAHITLGDESSLLAISYKGDLAGWRRKLAAYCEFNKRRWGVVSHQKIILSDGVEIDLRNSNVMFEE